MWCGHGAGMCGQATVILANDAISVGPGTNARPVAGWRMVNPGRMVIPHDPHTMDIASGSSVFTRAAGAAGISLASTMRLPCDSRVCTIASLMCCAYCVAASRIAGGLPTVDAPASFTT